MRVILCVKMNSIETETPVIEVGYVHLGKLCTQYSVNASV